MLRNPDPTETEDRRLARSSARGTWAGVVIAILGIVVTIWLANRANNGPAPMNAPVSPQASTPGSHTGLATSTEHLASGTCLTDTLQIISCEKPHPMEVVDTKDCTTQAAVTYLGGDPRLDALTPTVLTRTVSMAGHTVCVVAQQDHTFIGSLAHILATEKGQDFRWCQTTSPGTATVECSRPHDQEIFGKASSDKECIPLLSSYLDNPHPPAELNISARTIDGTPRCIVEATASQQLKRSLRGLRNGPLPIA